MEWRVILTGVASAFALPVLATAQESVVPHPTNYADRMIELGAKRDRITGNTRQIIEGDHLAKLAGIACETIDARPITFNKTGAAFEVACKGALGWMVSNLHGKPEAYDCLALAASRLSREDNHGNPAICRLPMNLRQEIGIQALLKQNGVTDCFATKAVHLGYGGEPKISRYEVACKNGGYIMDVPTPGSMAHTYVARCDTAYEVGGVCKLSR